MQNFIKKKKQKKSYVRPIVVDSAMQASIHLD